MLFLPAIASAPLDYVVEAGDDWIPLEMKMDVAPGSILDWTPKRVEPAGAKGWLIVNPEGKFAFESQPKRPVRFYGANLAFSAAFPEKATADLLADRLLRLGYNSVRLHHFDAQLAGGDKGKTSTKLDAAVLDKMDYLLAAFKKRGIYVSIDFYTIRKIRKDELVPGDLGMDEYKMLLLTSEEARENWWAFTSAVLDHKNPYTKLKWKDDPALAWICVVNENDAGSAGRSAAGRKFLTDAWQSFGNKGDWSSENDEGARFAGVLHSSAFRWMADKLHGIGARQLLTDNNGWMDQTALQINRKQLDYVDNHSYWDHPNFMAKDWGPPSKGGNGGGSALSSLGGGLKNIALSRLVGKPFTVSEFNFCAPNPFRAEGGLFMGALAARQDWDGLWRFAWAHDENTVATPGAMDYFNIQSDPMMLASERAAISLFLRRDLPPARPEGILPLESATLGAKGFASSMADNLFDVRLWSEVDGTGVDPVSVRPGPVTVDPEAGTMAVAGESTAGVIATEGADVRAGSLQVFDADERCVLWMTALDDRPLNRSARILLTHLTDCQDTGATFENPDRVVLKKWGRLPHLLHAGRATVRLRHDRPQSLRVYRLDMSGQRKGGVPTIVRNGTIEFDVSVKSRDGATMYYEVVGR